MIGPIVGPLIVIVVRRGGSTPVNVRIDQTLHTRSDDAVVERDGP